MLRVHVIACSPRSDSLSLDHSLDSYALDMTYVPVDFSITTSDFGTSLTILSGTTAPGEGLRPAIREFIAENCSFKSFSVCKVGWAA